MPAVVSSLISLTILFPLIIGIIRFNKIDNSYYPFILLLLMAFTSEVISTICRMVLHAHTTATINLYVLIECIILFFQFHTWGFLKKNRPLFYAVLAVFVMIWITEKIIFNKLDDFSPFFVVSYSFAILLLSINQINYMIVQDNQQLYRNAKFLLCIGFIIFFLYAIVYDAAHFVSKGKDTNITVATRIINMFNYMNAFVNLIYGVAVLLIPKKKNNLYFDRYFE